MERIMEQRPRSKMRPEDVAQICRNGHLVLGSLKRFPQFSKSFCEDCGTPTIEACQKCGWPIAGIGENAWMNGGGQYRPPRYCGECGAAFPWTESALKAAQDYTDDLEELTPEERAVLKETVFELTTDTPRTPVAASRLKKFLEKLSPTAGGILKKIVEVVLTEAAKKSVGL